MSERIPQAMTPSSLHDPRVQRERLWSQDKRLIEAGEILSRAVAGLPHDPACPQTNPRALVVGGFVRDAMTGLHPKDMDIEVYGVSPERLEQLLRQLFDNRVGDVGKAFHIIKVFLSDNLELDVSIPRRESKHGDGRRDFHIEGDPTMSVREAARRRDFTMNALCADLLTGEVIDPFNGLRDLEQGLLRMTDRERFQDDELRVYRAVQFCARLGLVTEPETMGLMKEMVARGDLAKLPPERVTEEFKKLLVKSPRPSVGFELMRELGIIERHFPELHALIGTQQEPEWHPEGDVWIHTMMVTDEASKLARAHALSSDDRLSLVMGALCHDLGKPATTTHEMKDGVMRIRSLGHEEAGEEPTRALLSRFSFSDTITTQAVHVAKNHLAPSMLFRELTKGAMNEKSYANAVRKLLRRIHPMPWQLFLLASEADSRGRAIPGVSTDPYEPGIQFEAIVKKYGLDKEPTTPLLQGRDLIALGIAPGKRMGELIKAVERARDEGDVATKEEGLEYLKTLL